LVKQQFLSGQSREIGRPNGHGRQAPQSPGRQTHQVARGPTAAKTFAQGKHHGGKRAGHAQPLHGPQPFGADEQRQQGRHPKG
jgi:hypothetical protein